MMTTTHRHGFRWQANTCTMTAILCIGALGMPARAPAATARQKENVPVKNDPPLKLVQTIRLENIRAAQPEMTPEQLAEAVKTSRMTTAQNHFDHFEVDLKRHRLFVVPEDHGTVEVYDVSSGKLVHSIGGFGTPHSTLYRPDIDEVFVTDGGAGSLRIFKGENYAPVKEVKLLVDADAIG